MDILRQLQEWYVAQCDGDWEHQHGVKIESLDNPGWLVKIDLTGTPLESKAFTPVESGLQEGFTTEDDWLVCSIVGGTVFRGAGDPSKLRAILDAFLAWATDRETEAASDA